MQSNHPKINQFQSKTPEELQIENDRLLALRIHQKNELLIAIANHNRLLAETRFNTELLVLNVDYIIRKHPSTYPEMTRLIKELSRLGEYVHVTNSEKFGAQDPVFIAASQAWISTSRMAQSVLHKSSTFNSPKYIGMLSQTLEKTMNLLSNPQDAHAMQALLAQSEFNRSTIEGPGFLRGLRASRHADRWYKACKDILEFSAKVILGCVVTTALIGWIPFLPFEIITGFAVLGLMVFAPLFALAALGTLLLQEKDRHFGLSRELSPSNAKQLHELADAVNPANYKETTKSTGSKFTAAVSAFFSKARAKAKDAAPPHAEAQQEPKGLYPSL